MSDSFATPWIVACQAPLYVEFLRQEFWSELPFPSPEDLPDPRIESVSPVQEVSPALHVDSLPLSDQGSPVNTHAFLQKFSKSYRRIKIIKISIP